VFKPTMKISGFDQPNYQVGNVVTVNGSNFTANGPITAAKVGVVSVAPVSNVTPTSFQVTLPDNAVTGAMSATNGNGTVSSSPATVKVRPTVTGDPSPTHGPAGTPVTFNGKTFIGTTSVKFNGAAATFTVGPGGTSIKAMVPAAATTGKVSFTNAGGTTLTANDFTVDPKISSFTPTTGPTGTVVTVTGTGFGGADRVDFLGPTPASTTVSGTPTNVTPTSLKVAVPPGAQTGKIQVHTTSGLSPVSGGSFSVTWSVTSISPTFGGYGTDVTIQGIGLTGVTQVKFNGFAGAIQPGGTNTELHVKTPSSGDPAITGHVTVWKMAASVQAPQDFTLLAISTFTPNHGAPGATIDITGHGFLPATSVKFNGTNAVPSVIDDGHISATVPDGATTGKISVTTPAGTVVSTDTFTVDTPPPSTATLQINEVSPGSAGLVEFKATQSGSTDGLTFDLDGTTIAALPDITVAKDDFVLLHFDSTFTNESTNKTSCTDPSCKPGAWDVATSLTGFSTGAHVLTVGVSGTTDIQDAVAFADPAAGSSPTDFIDALQSVQSFFQWAPTDCGGDPCSDGTSPTAQGISADWSTVDATHTAQRINDADTNLKDDWHVATDTLGATNGP
jgi:hypothetical protein